MAEHSRENDYEIEDEVEVKGRPDLRLQVGVPVGSLVFLVYSPLLLYIPAPRQHRSPAWTVGSRTRPAHRH